MNKKDFIKSVVHKVNDGVGDPTQRVPKKTIERLIDATFAALSDTLAIGESVKIDGFGKFGIMLVPSIVGGVHMNKRSYELTPDMRIRFFPDAKLYRACGLAEKARRANDAE